MKHVLRLEDAQPERETVVTIGMFDGVHLGHRRLLEQVVDMARARSAAAAVLTFYPHPKMVLQGWTPGFYLSETEERAVLLGQSGIEWVVTHEFNDEVRHMRARAFVERLKRHLRMSALCIGPDFALGYEREGNAALLSALGAELGYSVHVLDAKLEVRGEAVSSRRIREGLVAGEVGMVSELLGRAYSLGGEVVQGFQRGRTIGIPTANVRPSAERALPARGVYATWSVLEGARHASVTNVGVRPTFEGGQALSIEAHLLDFSGDLYGKRMEVEFVERLREERRFEGVDALVAQIRADIERGRSILQR